MNKRKRRFWVCTAIVAFASTAARPIFAQATAESVTFFCVMHEGELATMVRTSATEMPVIRWDEAVVSPDINLQMDCATSAARFQASYDEGLLNYITTGRMDGDLVVCSSLTLKGACQSRLLDLMPTPRPRLALQRVLQIPLPSGGPLSDTDCRAYVDWSRYIARGYENSTDDICPGKAIQ